MPDLSGVYAGSIVSRLWEYAGATGLMNNGGLEESRRRGNRPPVVRKGNEAANLILPPHASDTYASKLLSYVPRRERHLHFRSLRSSQALALSVFGALKLRDRVQALAGLRCEDGSAAFFPDGEGPQMELEHQVNCLGEPRKTSVDCWLHGTYRTAVECKFSETDFGTCSRPRLKKTEPNYCDGSYTHQMGRRTRCSLTEIGVRYWEHVPQTFSWDADRDLNPCPLRSTYQLVRNVLAATVRENGALERDGCHALVLYDARNPAFHPCGKAEGQWKEARASLKDQSLLRRCSWQRLAGHLAARPEWEWLVEGLEKKYGLIPQ